MEACRILLADDNEAVRENLRLVLETRLSDMNPEVLEAVGKFEAMQMISENPDLDFGVLDENMPIPGDGSEVAVFAQEYEIPTVICTSTPDDVTTEAREACLAILEKRDSKIDPAKLTDLIRQAILSKRRKRAA